VSAARYSASTTGANMSDDKTKANGQDRKRIDVSQAYELRDWSKKFGVSPDELDAAVRAVGDRADDVENFLKGERKGT
jgi:hypothetical protein